MNGSAIGRNFTGMNVGGSIRKVKDKKSVILKVIVTIICLLLLFEGVFHIIIIPQMAPVKLQFSGMKNLSAELLKSKLNDMARSTWIQFDATKAVSALSTIPSIEKVSVDKQFPDRVFIHVTERIPVARTIANYDGKAVSVQIDKNGVLFTGGMQNNMDISNIPLITGLSIEGVQDGNRLPSRYCALIERIYELGSLEQKYFAAVSEIQVISKDYGNYELVIYPIHAHVRVLADRSLDEEQLKKMMVALDIVNSIDSNAGEIDLRYGAVSYRKQ